MNPADLPQWRGLVGLLWETTWAASVAVLLVLLLRRALRHAFGAAVAYAAWALVPVAVIAVLLPATTVAVGSTPVAMTLHAFALPMATVQASVDYTPWLLLGWLAGAVATVLYLGRQQRAFRRGLGRLRPRADGLRQAQSVAGLPAVLGLLRPTIVVPADFDTRYSPEERQLMHAHERNHIVHGDLQLNALVAMLRSVFWFNPLLHHATRHFRHDQELACDQRVIAQHPHGRRAYGEAMFKIQLAAQPPLPLGCHWAAFDKARSHPLKERIAMLKQPVPSFSRWIVGSAVVGMLTVGGGVAAWAAQPARATSGAQVSASRPSASAHSAVAAAPRIRSGHGLSQQSPPSSDAAPAAPASSASPSSSRSMAVNRTPAPPYPADALAQRIAGKVLLIIDIDAHGKPVNVKVEKSEPADVFDQAAINSAKQWQFKPELQNGKPVAGRVRVPIQFVPPGAPRPSSSSNLSTVGEQVAAGAIEIQPSQLLALNLSPQYRWVRIDQLKQRDVTIECDIGTGSLAAPDGQRYCGHRL